MPATPEPRSADTAAAVAELLAQAGQQLRRAARDQLEPYGITWGQLRTLRHLAAAGGPLRMSELARAAGIVPRSATTVVDDLEADGLVRRRTDPTDRRATLVELTDRAEELLAALRQGRAAGAQRLLERLDRQEQVQLRRLLEQLVADDA